LYPIQTPLGAPATQAWRD